MNSYEPVEILIVEDNLNDAELMLRALRKQKVANQVVVVEDGEEALDFIFRRGKYSQVTGALRVVFLDLKLPKVGGLEVLKAIKSNEKTKWIPVVVVTSSSLDPDIKAAYELGANSYVIKPVNFTTFVDSMSQVGLYWMVVNEALKE